MSPLLLTSKYMILKTNEDQIVGYYKGDKAKDLNGRLSSTIKKAVSPFARLEVEQANVGNGLVHIRCCYNNKYWVLESGEGRWIRAAANETGEDTLFEPVQVSSSDDELKFRFRHVLSDSFIRLTSSFLCAAGNATSESDVFRVFDWGNHLVLPPRHVAFKGDNGKYLQAIELRRNLFFLQFSADDPADAAALNDVFTDDDGTVRIQNFMDGKFWRRSPNWIWADSDLDRRNRDLMFEPVRVNDRLVALKNLGNGMFCKRLTDFWQSCLNAAERTATIEARMEVEEVLLSRSIVNVNFHLDDARIYDVRLREMPSQDATNRTDQEDTLHISLSYTTNTTRYFNSSVSYKSTITTSFGGSVPRIGLSGGVELSNERAQEFEWGNTVTEERVVETTYTMVVPPRTHVRLTLWASEAKYDVPFSYTQRDTRVDGIMVEIPMDDGIYTGLNSYNFRYETKQEPLT